MTIHSLYRYFSTCFRTRRMRRFAREFGLTTETRVLDVGGTLFNWRLLSFQPCLTVLNLSTAGMTERDGITWVAGDGRRLPFKDRSFDIVYSNSVMEHLGTLESQRRFAAECRRVGVRYFVQTPCMGFPVDPHLLTPFVHWLPAGLRRPLLRNFTLWGVLARPSRQRCESFTKEIRYPSAGELRELFPEARVRRERFLGLAKSFIIQKT